MSHSDLMPGNVLMADGRLTGVIDVGGLGPADPALDLVGAWHLLEVGPRQVLRDRLGCGDEEWARGQDGLSPRRSASSGTTRSATR